MSRQACLIVQLIVEFVLFFVYIKFPSKLLINKKKRQSWFIVINRVNLRCIRRF